jgi:hypothetical protein
MHMLSNDEIERYKKDKDSRVSHLAFCLALSLERNNLLQKTLEEAVAWAKKVPSSLSEQEMIEEWLLTLVEG